MTPTAYAARMSLFFGALFLIYGIFLPYLPVWLDWKGLDETRIALIVSAPFFIRLAVSPAVALWADDRDSHLVTSIQLAAIALICAIALLLFGSAAAIAIAATTLSLAKTSIMPLAETIAVRGVFTHRLDYGRMRLWGSLTFIVATVGGGWWIDLSGPSVIPLMIAMACALTLVAAFALPQASSDTPRHRPERATARPETRRSRGSLGEAAALLRRRDLILLLLASGAAQASHATYYTFGSLHWLQQGIDPTTVGLLWAIGVVAEIVLFAYSGWFLSRFGGTGLLMLAGAAGMARWGIMAFDPPALALYPLQTLHALTFGAAHLGAIHLVHERIPASLQGTGQALHASVGMGIAMGIAMLVAGQLYAGFAGGAYWGMAAISALALIAALRLKAEPGR